MIREVLGRYATVPHRPFLARAFGLHPLPRSMRPSYRAAVGDVAVVDALASLGDEWFVRHAVAVEGADTTIDCLVIGPPGAFAVTIRHLLKRELWVSGGVILVDGDRMPYIKECESTAVQASQLLSDAVGDRVEATPCLVIVDPRSVTVSRPPRDITILTPRELRPWLRGLRPTLSADRLTRLRTAASSTDAWPERATSTADMTENLHRFRELQATVNQARRLRLAWIIGGLVLIWLVALIGIGGFATGIL